MRVRNVNLRGPTRMPLTQFAVVNAAPLAHCLPPRLRRPERNVKRPVASSRRIFASFSANETQRLIRIERVARKIQRPGPRGIAGDVDQVDRIEDRPELFIRPPHAELVD